MHIKAHGHIAYAYIHSSYIIQDFTVVPLTTHRFMLPPSALVWHCGQQVLLQKDRSLQRFTLVLRKSLLPVPVPVQSITNPLVLMW